MIIKKIIKNCLPYGIIELLRKCKTNVYNQNICERLFIDMNIIVDEKRERTVNIFFPGDIKPIITAGPLSILYLADFLHKMGLKVRLLFFPYKISSEKIKANICKFDCKFANFLDSVEIDFMEISNNSTNNIFISTTDIAVATFWESAFYAKQIQSYCKNNKFIYFIQDDERTFYKNSTEHILVENTYQFDFYGLFSTEILRQYFIEENVGNIRHKKSISQESPSYYKLSPKDRFVKRNGKKRFAFYARSGRNCCEYAEHLIKKACQEGILTKEWEIYGIGAGETKDVEIGKECYIHLQKSIPLQAYRDNLHTYDVALVLMETPHYSMLPIDFALSGCIVITNTFKTKTKEALSNISKNILGSNFDVESMLESIKQAVLISGNLEDRYKNAIESNYSTIDNIFNKKHEDWINNILME
jgi:hypothetical protein